MTDVQIENDRLALTVSTAGGAIWRFAAKTANGLLPLMREPAAGPARSALTSACFPLVPFGNRVSGNRFAFAGAQHDLSPNMPWDPHYLHGDGWTSEWTIAGSSATRLRLDLTHEAAGTPYSYDVAQDFALDDATLVVTLSVVNRGRITLPFGLGWHPYFPLTPQTSLRAEATSYWEEGEGWLPTVEKPLPDDLSFAQERLLPRRWVNNGFEGWSRRARLHWPERKAALAIEAGALFERFFLFVSDPAFDPGYAYDFFCFEPMSHSADAHNGRGGGLVALEPGEGLEGSVRFTFEARG